MEHYFILLFGLSSICRLMDTWVISTVSYCELNGHEFEKLQEMVKQREGEKKEKK